MANTSNKVLYIDNVTTYDYVKKFRESQTVDDPRNAKFTYVVFTEYTRHNNYGYSYHGDIFFNGSKITYINDVDVTSPVTDGKDTFIGYVNENSGLSFARSSIVIGGISNTYELFNVNAHEITYEYVSNLGLYTTEHQGTWGVEVIEPSNYDGILQISGNNNTGTIVCGDVEGNLKIHLTYSFTINDGDEQVECIDHAYYSIYNVTTPTSVDFGNTPSTLPYGAYFTPLMNIEPHSAIQTELTFSSSYENYVEILNTKTGTFFCKSPGTSTITCTYDGHSVTKDISVNKVNAHLSVSAYNTTYLYNAPGYKNTSCYAHYDAQGLSINGYTWFLNSYELGGNAIKSNLICYNSEQPNATTSNTLNSETINIVKFKLPDNLFTNNEAAIQLYAPKQQITQTHSITVTDYEYHPETSSVSFVVEAIAATNDNTTNHFVDTNYSFDNSLGINDFTVTDITNSGNTTFTYVTAHIEPNQLNDLYAQSVASYNQSIGEENTNVTCYNIINVHTADSSFVSYSYYAPYTIYTYMFDRNAIEINTNTNP